VFLRPAAAVFGSLLVGGALAGAGCALQALLRNPLASRIFPSSSFFFFI